MIQKIKKAITAGAATLSTMLLVAAPVSAAGTLVVTPGNQQGWLFNPDPTTATPYEFTEDQASIGEGSLYVPAIDSDATDKFIAAKVLDDTLVADFNSVSYDFLIAGDGEDADANQFYLNVYTNLEDSDAYYDCRFDYVPTVGSTLDFTTATFNATDTPVDVAGTSCPATLAEMPEGSTVSFIAINVGDTSDSDTGLAGYLDNVVISTLSDVTTYDFELNEAEPEPEMPVSKDDCKKGGWEKYEIFKNQGDCVSWVASGERNLPTF